MIETERNAAGVLAHLEGALVVAEEGKAGEVKVGVARMLDEVDVERRVQVVMTLPDVPIAARELIGLQSEFARAWRRLLDGQMADAKKAGMDDPEALGLYMTMQYALRIFLANVVSMSDWTGKTETDLQRDLMAFLEDVSRETLTLDAIHDLRDVREEAAAATASHEIPPETPPEAQ